METYIVTIAECTIELEAENSNKARALGVRAFIKMAKEKWNLDFRVTPIRRKASVRLKIPRFKPKSPRLTNLLDYLPKEDKEWLTGFWEGDGSISIQGSSLSITFSQKNPQILLYIRKLLKVRNSLSKYGGTWSLGVGTETKVYSLLKIIGENIVSQSRVNQINNLVTLEPKPNLISHKPTYPWFAGFWDAEGHIDYYENGGQTLRLSISQKDPSALKALLCLVGKVSLHQWKSSGFTKELHWYLEIGGVQARVLIPILIKYSENKEKKDKLLKSIGSLVVTSKVWRTFLEEVLSNRKLSS